MNDPAVPPLIRYLEDHLGPISSGFKVEGERVQLSRFENQPVHGATTLTTLGLSNHELHLADGGSLREELIVAARKESEIDYLGRALHGIAKDILERHHALLRGDVLGPRGPVVPDSTLEAFFCIHPAYWPESFDLFEGPEFEVGFLWLVPITKKESDYIANEGWKPMLDKIEAQDPDLLDLKRPSLKL
jgi:hypothetical protein